MWDHLGPNGVANEVLQSGEGVFAAGQSIYHDYTNGEYRTSGGGCRLRDVTVTSGNSPDGILHRDQEAELILWESGEAEFGSSDPEAELFRSTIGLIALMILGLC
jgi:hypothetical protein